VTTTAPPIRPLACKELVELVTDYLEGRLGPENHRRFEQHIAGCEACTRYLEQMRITIELTGRLREEDLEPGVRAELLEAFRSWRRSPSDQG
jgi:anti-sigma factor RsiW